jgi:hypothetical protein
MLSKEKNNIMQKLSLLILSLSVICFSSCISEPKELTEAEIRVNDSISKIVQKQKADSLKKTNPLLILPPDSTYTGDYVDKYPSGIIKFKGFYRFGERHGQWMSFYPNGLAWSEMHYDKGLREGPNLTYFETGKLRYTGFYKNDKQDSVWTYYDSIGKIAKKVIYKNDHVVKELPLK